MIAPRRKNLIYCAIIANIDKNIQAFVKPKNHKQIVAEILGYSPEEKIYPPFTGCADEDRFCKAISLWYIERSNRNLLGLFQTHGFNPNRNRRYNSVLVTLILTRIRYYKPLQTKTMKPS